MGKITFTVLAKDKKTNARVGKLKTPHGDIQTPVLIPVGTQATVKGLTPKDLEDIGAQIVLANTYHLHLRPGEKVVKKMGGLGKFMGWDRPTMTDSGGFQVFSLGAAQQEYIDDEVSLEGTLTGKKLTKFSKAGFISSKLTFSGEKEHFIRQAKNKTKHVKPAKIDEEGVTFYSHLDGSKRRLDAKSSITMQEAIGADLIVAFDDHESPLWNYAQTKASLERTNRWGLESLKHHKRKDQLMYGVTHGGVFQDLREASARFTEKHFAAIAIGGAYTSKEVLYNVIDWTMPLVDEQKPRHLLGIGEVVDLFEGVSRGIDFFDCVAPTRRARHGSLYISPKNGGMAKQNFTMQLLNREYTTDEKPIDPGCQCYTCQHFTRAYVQHLFKAKELLAFRLATYHNVYFMTKLMEQIRNSIGEGRFISLKEEWVGYAI